MPWGAVCFHAHLKGISSLVLRAQQVAEKMLKALLVYHGVTPEKTHDSVRLLTECVSLEEELADLEGARAGRCTR